MEISNQSGLQVATAVLPEGVSLYSLATQTSMQSTARAADGVGMATVEPYHWKKTSWALGEVSVYAYGGNSLSWLP